VWGNVARLVGNATLWRKVGMLSCECFTLNTEREPEFMTESKSLIAELKQRRDNLLLKLREREPEMVAQLIQLNVAISGLDAGSARRGEYSGFRKPSEAIFAYLDQTAKPQVREDMCRALVNGGYGDGTDPYWDLIRTTYYQIKKKRLIEINGLIGKADWPKKMFEEQ
jgi:hypothetical protein